MPSINPFRTALRSATTSHTTTPLAMRAFHRSVVSRMPYKDDQDRESLKPKSSEYSKSGSDGQVADNPDAAFNPDKTSPEAAKETAGQGNTGNPLESSPANKEVAQGGSGHEEDKTRGGNQKQSGGGSPEKKGERKP